MHPIIAFYDQLFVKKATLYRYILHALFWFIFGWMAYRYTLDFLKLQKIDMPRINVFAYCLVYVPMLMLPVYLNYLVLLPRYFLKRQFLLYSLFWVFSVLLGSMAVCVVEDLFLRSYQLSWIYSREHLLSRVPYIALFNFLVHFAFLFEEVSRKQQAESNLKKANAESELKWLKAQVNPHFLFNALNNIYSLAYQRSEETAPAVMKLSQMMRYMLQGGAVEKISIQEEAEYLQHYIQLQQLKKRYAEKIQSVFLIDHPDLQIEPMLLINFVENAFKHCNLEKEEGWVRIELRTTEKQLHFSAENTMDSSGSRDKGSGIGIANVTQRLELLYPLKHQLQINTKNNVYRVDLDIQF